jgi:hypothetical protein
MDTGDKKNEEPDTTDDSSDDEPVRDVPAPDREHVESGYLGPGQESEKLES